MDVIWFKDIFILYFLCFVLPLLKTSYSNEFQQANVPLQSRTPVLLEFLRKGLQEFWQTHRGTNAHEDVCGRQPMGAAEGPMIWSKTMGYHGTVQQARRLDTSKIFKYVVDPLQVEDAWHGFYVVFLRFFLSYVKCISWYKTTDWTWYRDVSRRSTGTKIDATAFNIEDVRTVGQRRIGNKGVQRYWITSRHWLDLQVEDVVNLETLWIYWKGIVRS